MSRSIVLLPAPLGPTTVVTPASNIRSTSSTIAPMLLRTCKLSIPARPITLFKWAAGGACFGTPITGIAL